VYGVHFPTADVDAAADVEASDPEVAETSSTAVASPLLVAGPLEASERKTERIVTMSVMGIAVARVRSEIWTLNLTRNQI
jgi:hypothetical protein